MRLCACIGVVSAEFVERCRTLQPKLPALNPNVLPFPTDSVQETQYYASDDCIRSTSPYGQSDYTIATNDVCNAVHSPHSPVEDDSVGWTEFVGLSYYVAPSAAPTLMPTRKPTGAPTVKPTAVPTPAPTPNNLVHFAAQQVRHKRFHHTYAALINKSRLPLALDCHRSSKASAWPRSTATPRSTRTPWR
jgi:hypothetical protein